MTWTISKTGGDERSSYWLAVWRYLPASAEWVLVATVPREREEELALLVSSANAYQESLKGQ